VAINRQSSFTPHERLSDDQLSDLYEFGAVLIPAFFSREEIADAQRDIGEMFAEVTARHVPSSEVLNAPELREFSTGSFFDYSDFPYDSEALNLIGSHPAVLAAAKKALQSDRILMHYNYASAKYGGKQNYSQPLHLDSPMHSFFAPSQNPHYSAINFVVYLSDVDSLCGPLSYVPLTHTRDLPYGKITLDSEENAAFESREVTTTGAAGSLLIYFHQTYHRGTNLRGPGCTRFQLVASYHAREASPFIGGAPWPRKALTSTHQWEYFLPFANAEQLDVIGIPPPGHDFWTESILDELGRRFPGWNLDDYYAALRDVSDIAPVRQARSVDTGK